MARRPHHLRHVGAEAPPVEGGGEERVEAREVFSYAACGLPYVLSGDIGEPAQLRRTDYGAARDTDYFERVKRVEVLPGRRAVALDVDRRLLTVRGPQGHDGSGFNACTR